MDKKLSVRDRIMRTASRLFYAQGILNTGINQIISESEVAKASFYQHFPSKNDLVKACLVSYNSYIGETMERLAGQSATFREFIGMWIEQLKKDMQLIYRGCPIAEAAFQVDPTNREMQEVVKNIIEEWYEHLEKIFTYMKHNGELSPEVDNRLLAQRMIHLHEGALTMWRLTNDVRYIDDLAAFMTDLMEF